MFFLRLLLACVLATGASCSRSNQNGETLDAEPIDPCSLLTGDEIKSVQGEAVVEAKSSNSLGAEFIVSQCYFRTATPENSVVLTITEKGPAKSGRSLKELWKQTFESGGGSEEAREKRGKNKEEEREGPKPERIEGVGDEAFWTGTRFGGALYVLNGDYHLRISVGGADKKETKKEKCRALAEKILERL